MAQAEIIKSKVGDTMAGEDLGFSDVFNGVRVSAHVWPHTRTVTVRVGRIGAVDFPQKPESTPLAVSHIIENI